MSTAIPPPAHVAARGALLLDFDGTLVPIAPQPDAVQVPALLVGLLGRLHCRLDGALAIVSGREIATIDRFLAPLVLPAAGEHGVALRHDPNTAPTRATVPPLPKAIRRALATVAEAHPGTLVEEKPAGIAVHYRGAPHAAEAVLRAVRAIAAGDPRFALLRGHMVVELRPAGIDKGTAVRALMRVPEFAGRLPVFVGDDVTDEDGIAAARALGGHGLRLEDSFRTPAALAEWLAAIVEVPDATAA
jgi:trehalose 6-phosphate phosphatase